MKNTEFVKKLKDIATNYKTLYVMGCFGAPMNATNRNRYSNNNDYNRDPDRVAMISKATANTFGFDCVCLIKAVLWGWSGNKNLVYGGARFKSNGVRDFGTEEAMALCTDVSTDFSNIEIGEIVWMRGHVGVYIGDGLVVESSPKWKNGVQITACNCEKSGYNSRKWTKHGKLRYIEYDNKPEAIEMKTCSVKLPVLKKGIKDSSVRSLQLLLIGLGYSCGNSGADGSFGAATEKAVRSYQKAKGLVVDGSVGPATWAKLLG